MDSPPSEPHALGRLYEQIRIQARLLSNRLPHSVAIDAEDLFQEGVVGLLEAAQRFDPAQGAKFETFVGHRIRGAMLDALRRLSWAGRGHLKREGADVPMCSMDEVMANGRTVLEEVVDERPGPEDLAYVAQLVERLPLAVGALSARERTAVLLKGVEEMSDRAIGLELGVTASRVTQMRHRAYERLRYVVYLQPGEDETLASAALHAEEGEEEGADATAAY